MKQRTAIILLGASGAFTLVCLWASLQVLAPKIIEFAQVLESIPHLVTMVALGCGITYIFNSLKD